MNIIEIDQLSYIYESGKTGIHDITLSIRRGGFYVLAGANGSGKTTLLRHLNGLLLPQKGSVTIDGRSVSKDVKYARRMVGFVFQDADSQIVGETVFDDVAFGPENLCWAAEKVTSAVQKALKDVGLDHLAFQSPHLLSGGEKRKLAIAGVLAMNPEVIVLDEPFANLDFDGVRQVLTQILALHQSGHTIIASAHDLEKIVAHADRLILLHKGSIAVDGAPLEAIGFVEQYGVRMPCSMKIKGTLESWLS